jgi:PadR family transcriptional regulator, regulatory protein PadR
LCEKWGFLFRRETLWEKRAKVQKPHYRTAHLGLNQYLLFSKKSRAILLLATKRYEMKQTIDIQQGTLALMVLKTLDVLGPLHGYGIARRIEQVSGDQLAMNQGTLYPLLLRLEQEGSIASEWAPSENNRRARFYRLTRAGKKQLQVELQGWQQTADIIARFLTMNSETQS